LNIVRRIEQGVRRIGYRTAAIQSRYTFNDFTADDTQVQSVDLAVFTQTPASYRSAAFGVVQADAAEAERVVTARRALGAPLFFVVENAHVSLWQVFGVGPSRLLQRVPLGHIDSLFETHKATWSPEAIHRAKSIGKLDSAYQLDFVDAGLLPAIEGQIHLKLDRLLTRVLGTITIDTSTPSDGRTVFQGVFRLLAAKVLFDRQHTLTQQWNPQRVGSVLNGIGAYYNLSQQERFASAIDSRRFAEAWTMLRDGVNVANISSDDLAYVYENTLVSPQTRLTFSTHSTPRQVAEFIATRLGLWRPECSNQRVYEPFTGAGVLLIAALRHLREALPSDWNDRQRHLHLVKHLRGSELDTFACEVATLSLILADYPNTNGWKIDNTDLFEKAGLAKELANADIILCNPPFEPLTDDERQRYPEIAAVGGTKAEVVLRLALQANPTALGFVLPRSFVLDRAYRSHRAAIAERFADIEVVSLPDGIFRESTVESALLIARAPTNVGQLQRVRSSEVDDRDRRRFLATGGPSRYREESRSLLKPASDTLWIAPLDALWRHVASLPKLGDLVHAHWGIRWHDGGQRHAASARPETGRRKGIATAADHRAFALGRTWWLDVTPARLYGGGELPWNEAKILCNAGRSTRGKWRICAAVDRDRLVTSQQFAALWPNDSSVDLDAIAAVINGPLANAFLSEHSADRRLRIATLLAIPIPTQLSERIGDMARQYAHLLASHSAILGGERILQELIDEIDAAVLADYDLPPRLVRSLLASFRNQRRPLAHEWHDWNVSESDPALSLAELRSEWARKSRRGWLQQELPALPKRESSILMPYMR